MDFTKEELMAIKELLENATVQLKSANKALELLNKVVMYIDGLNQPAARNEGEVVSS